MRLQIEDDGMEAGIRLHLSGVPQRDGMIAAATHMRAAMAWYPPARRGEAIWVSAAQRRGFFAKLRSGEIEVPYIRGSSPGSMRMMQRWEVTEAGPNVLLQNNASYAGFVQGKRQALYHKITGHRTVDQMLAREGSMLARIVVQGMYRSARDR